MSSPIDNGGGGFPNPLGDLLGGLIGGLVGEVGKMLKGPDLSSIGEVGKLLLNKVGSFSDGSGSAAQTGQDSSQQAATTEFAPSKDQATAQAGYQPVADHNELMGAGDSSEAPAATAAQSASQRSSSSSAATAQESSSPAPSGATDAAAPAQRAQTSSAATAAHDSSPVVDEAQRQAMLAANPNDYWLQLALSDPKVAVHPTQAQENQAELEALKPLLANFKAVDGYGIVFNHTDNFINTDQLTAVVGNSSLPKELRDAAQYLLDHPKLITDLQVMTGAGDASISLDSVSRYVSKLLNVGSPDQTQAGNSTPSGGTTGTQTTQSDPPSGGYVAPPPCQTQNDHSLDGMVERLDGRLDKLQGEIDAQVKVLEDPNASDAAVRAAQTKMTQLSQKMQTIMEQRKAMFELISNLSKAFSDMQMVAIRHIG